MKKLRLITLMFFCSINYFSFAQTFEVPQNYVLKVASDYAKYEKDIIACVNWLESTPLNTQEQKRAEANAFLMKWITGSPTVTIELGSDKIIKCTDKNPNLLFLLLGGWTRYSLLNNYSKDSKKGLYEGFKCVITVYKKGEGVKKDKDLQEMVDLFDKGELENWISTHVK